MACPYLWGRYLRSCSAARDVYVPSRFEFHEYCQPERYDRFCLCPVYRGSAGTAQYAAKGGAAQPETQPCRRSVRGSIP